jgi:uncharacterized membrane protein YccC
MNEANTTQEIDGPDEQLQPLLGTDETEQFRGRWRSIQSNFVDEPEHSVQEADELVTQLMQQLTQTFQAERQSLESQLSKQDEVSTEELRVALQRYRSFFERLLST